MSSSSILTNELPMGYKDIVKCPILKCRKNLEVPVFRRSFKDHLKAAHKSFFSEEVNDLFVRRYVRNGQLFVLNIKSQKIPRLKKTVETSVIRMNNVTFFLNCWKLKDDSVLIWMQADRPKWQGGTIFRYKISIGHESFEDCAECPVKSLDFDKFEGNKLGVLYSLDYLKKHATNKNEMMIAIQINRMTFGDSQSQPA